MNIYLNTKNNNVFYNNLIFIKFENIINYNSNIELKDYSLCIFDMDMDNIDENIYENELLTFIVFNLKDKYKDYENIIEVLDYDFNNIINYNLITHNEIFYYNVDNRKIMNIYYTNINKNTILNIQKNNINDENFENNYNNNILILDKKINHNIIKLLKQSNRKIIKPTIINKKYENCIHITNNIEIFFKNISKLNSSFLIIDENNKNYETFKEYFGNLIINENSDINNILNNFDENQKLIKFVSLGNLYKFFSFSDFLKNVINIL
jgi:hypothetical protein